MMNKRARQLAKPNLEKEWYSKYGESVQEDHYFFTPEDLDEFAQLIIQECMNKIENEASQYAEPVWAVELINDIKDHFGVEE
jgi:hypothetical protein